MFRKNVTISINSIFRKCHSTAVNMCDVHVKRCSEQCVGGRDEDVKYFQKCSQVISFTYFLTQTTFRQLDNCTHDKQMLWSTVSKFSYLWSTVLPVSIDGQGMLLEVH